MLLKKLKIGEKMFLGFGLVMLLMLLVIGNTFVNFSKQAKSVEANLHTYEVLSESDGILISLINMETGIRGYVITGDESFLEPYNQGKLDYEGHYNKLKELAFDNPKHQQLLDAINGDYSNWLQWQTNEIIAGREKVSLGQLTMDELISTAQTKQGKIYMDKIREAINKITKEEQNSLVLRNNERLRMENQTRIIMILGSTFSTVLAFIIAYLVIKMVVIPVRTVTHTFKEISEGDVDLEVRLPVNSQDELGQMSKYFNRFMEKLREQVLENKNQSWLKAGKAELSEKVRENQDIKAVCDNILKFVVKYINAQIGAIYVKTDNNSFQRLSTYAYEEGNILPKEFKLGQGIIGQCALEKQQITITNVPSNYTKISTGLGAAVPKIIVVDPCLYHDNVECIIELGSFSEFTDVQLRFIKQVSESIAISISSAKAQLKMKELLDKTLIQAEELQAQQEELRQTNEELEEQAIVLRQSEKILQIQQEELRVTNEELEEKTRNLELQKNDILAQNEKLNEVQVEIEEKSQALESANKYKSEFLANMSHELRTPLNSILVLSQILSDKKDDTPFTDKQLQYAKTINSSGKDLLRLINDILDISKIEAGKMEVNLERINLKELSEQIKASFEPIAMEKDLNFRIQVEAGVPEYIVSDDQRVKQIINNLLSNAFKFTSKGEVVLSFSHPKVSQGSAIQEELKNLITIRVTDTGIGIPKNKEKLIFEAFKQSDGTISRKYGGTGLGLSISKELVNLLGGEIHLESHEGKGSIFTVILPNKDYKYQDLSETETLQDKKHEMESQREQSQKKLKDNVENFFSTYEDTSLINSEISVKGVEEGQKVSYSMEKSLLIIEDDKNFLAILSDLAVEKGFKVLVATKGEEGINLAAKYKPSAIILDIGLPDINGWKVIDILKENQITKNIPIHIISGREEELMSNNFQGIIGYLKKPVNLGDIYNLFNKVQGNGANSLKNLLVADETVEEHSMLIDSLSKTGANITVLNSGAQIYNLMKTKKFDCIILDLKLKDMNGLELLNKLDKEHMINLPILIYTEKNITEEEEEELEKFTKSIILKGNHSVERLVDEASLFLHDVDSKIETDKIKLVKASHEKEDSLKDKKVLIVDDDMRNVFALTSALEEKGITVIAGRNGEEGVEKFKQNPDINLVLMDVMMPKMDGLTATREIRKYEKFSKIPIIAITAKAMKDDRQKCIEAGADDYLTKPIEMDKLISLLRVWLYK